MLYSLPEATQLCQDPSPAAWVTDRLWPWGPVSGEWVAARVGSIVPEGFDAYARILHPAYGGDPNAGTVRWSALAEQQGVTLGAETGFAEVSGLQEGDPGWDHAVPALGSLPRAGLVALGRLLALHTTAPERCWFCFWEGWGFWWSSAHSPLFNEDAASADQVADYERRARAQDVLLSGTTRVRSWHRDYFLFSGPLSAAGRFAFGPGQQSPNLWWPQDHAWCVASEIDYHSSYVGGSRELIEAVLASPALEAIEVRLEDPGEAG